MKPLFIFLLLLSSASYARERRVDTFYYANGRIKDICFRKVDRSLLFTLSDYTISYDSLTGLKTEEGNWKRYKAQTGTWRYYDQGKLAKKEKYRFGQLKTALKIENGRKKLIYIQYGIFSSGGNVRADTAIESKYGMITVGIGGCFTTRSFRLKVAIRNRINDVIQTFRFGRGWKEQKEKESEEFYDKLGWFNSPTIPYVICAAVFRHCWCEGQPSGQPTNSSHVDFLHKYAPF
jgi:hypothetical protein